MHLSLNLACLILKQSKSWTEIDDSIIQKSFMVLVISWLTWSWYLVFQSFHIICGITRNNSSTLFVCVEFIFYSKKLKWFKETSWTWKSNFSLLLLKLYSGHIFVFAQSTWILIVVFGLGEKLRREHKIFSQCKRQYDGSVFFLIALIVWLGYCNRQLSRKLRKLQKNTKVKNRVPCEESVIIWY